MVAVLKRLLSGKLCRISLPRLRGGNSDSTPVNDETISLATPPDEGVSVVHRLLRTAEVISNACWNPKQVLHLSSLSDEEESMKLWRGAVTGGVTVGAVFAVGLSVLYVIQYVGTGGAVVTEAGLTFFDGLVLQLAGAIIMGVATWLLWPLSRWLVGKMVIGAVGLWGGIFLVTRVLLPSLSWEGAAIAAAAFAALLAPVGVLTLWVVKPRESEEESWRIFRK